MVRLGNRTYRPENRINPVNLVLFPIQTVGAISESRPFVSRELEFPLTDSNESFLKLTHKGSALAKPVSVTLFYPTYDNSQTHVIKVIRLLLIQRHFNHSVSQELGYQTALFEHLKPNLQLVPQVDRKSLRNCHNC